MTIGIYKLNFTGTDKVYIGQSSNIEMRFNRHISNLRANNHTRKLLEAYKEYGEPTLQILEVVKESELSSVEEKYIVQFNSVDSGFNTNYSYGLDGCSLSGESNPYSKYTNNQIIQVFRELVKGVSLKDVSSKLCVGYYTVRLIANGTQHRWIEKIYPSDYAYLISLNGTRKSSSKTLSKLVSSPPEVISPTGEIHQILNIKEFTTIHNISNSSLSKLIHSKISSCKGWKLKKQ